MLARTLRTLPAAAATGQLRCGLTPSCLAMARLLTHPGEAVSFSGRVYLRSLAAHAFSVLSRLIDPRLHPVPQNISFEFRKQGQHACESSCAGGGKIERFAYGTRRRRPYRRCVRAARIGTTWAEGGQWAPAPQMLSGRGRVPSNWAAAIESSTCFRDCSYPPAAASLPECL